MTEVRRPWAALITMLIGFFMILVDATIVSVANPAIMEGLNTNLVSLGWVTSAYLLAFAVPLLLAGRLGDRFGQKAVFQTGMAIFTAASLLCGLSTSIGMLITARVIQGLGAALMSPQPMAVVTKIFPPAKRGAPMGLWGATSGIAMLVGPLLGGVLVDAFGWEAIFLINVPVGVAGLILAGVFVPKLPTSTHQFDLLGVLLSAAGLFCIVFAVQEGESHNWGTLWGPITIWMLAAFGVLMLAAFVFWQARNKREPLLPLRLFSDRDFALANAAIVTVGFAITAMPIPLMFYFQQVHGMKPTEAALMLVPMAIIGGVCAPFVGARMVPRFGARPITVMGLILLAISIGWFAMTMTPTVAVGLLLLPSGLLGLASSCIWSPLALAATHHLSPTVAGAGAGVYNVTRQIGSVFGSASIIALMTSRIAAELPAGATGPSGAQSGELPAFLKSGFADALAQSLWLPTAVALVGAIIASRLTRRGPAPEFQPTDTVADEPEAGEWAPETSRLPADGIVDPNGPLTRPLGLDNR